MQIFKSIKHSFHFSGLLTLILFLTLSVNVALADTITKTIADDDTGAIGLGDCGGAPCANHVTVPLGTQGQFYNVTSCTIEVHDHDQDASISYGARNQSNAIISLSDGGDTPTGSNCADNGGRTAHPHSNDGCYNTKSFNVNMVTDAIDFSFRHGGGDDNPNQHVHLGIMTCQGTLLTAPGSCVPANVTFTCNPVTNSVLVSWTGSQNYPPAGMTMRGVYGIRLNSFPGDDAQCKNSSGQDIGWVCSTPPQPNTPCNAGKTCVDQFQTENAVANQFVYSKSIPISWNTPYVASVQNTVQLTSNPTQNMMAECRSTDQTFTCSGATGTPTPAPTSTQQCGNGKLEQPEQCDDGNYINTDTCDNSCRLVQAVCGNSHVETGEDCDDGNTNQNDYCVNCKINIPQCNAACPTTGTCPAECPCTNGICQVPRCGSSCTNDANCPLNNSCYNGRCRLSACMPDYLNYSTTYTNTYQSTYNYPYSSPYSGPVPPYQTLVPTYTQNRQNALDPVCTSDGCTVIACGGECGPGRLCPAGCACTKSGFCGVSDTALIDKDTYAYILSAFLITLGVLLYRLDFTANIWKVFNALGGRYLTAWFDKTQKQILEDKHLQRFRKFKKSSSDSFEDKFNK